MIIVSLFTIWRTQACYNESTANESTVTQQAAARRGTGHEKNP